MGIAGTRQRLGLLASLGALAGGMLAFSAPASASGSLECDPVTVSHQNYAVCELFGTATPPNSQWTFDGNYLSAFDNQVDARFACGATGTRWTVRVNYTDNTGAPASGISNGECGGITP